MCGIAGFCNCDEDDIVRIRQMTDAIAHRGPDSEGYWIAEDRAVVLGHRRLSILDCSENGSQPMISKSGRFVLSYNGEIYNHLKIRADIDKGQSLFNGTSDTETLVEMFDLYGVDRTLDMLKGMFAIALYDTIKKVLYLIRDRVGEKPLYYGFINGSFTFASDLSSFRAVYGNKLRIDKGSVELYFRRGYIPAPYSIYKDIFKVEPGHYVRISAPFEKTDDVEYWSAYDVSSACRNNPFRGTAEEAEKELEMLIKESLKGQLLSDVPLGAFLSAGIDSSTIVSLMQEISDHPVRTFTIGVETSGYDEAPVARQVAGVLGTEHVEEYISIPEIKASIPAIVKMYSEPFADSSQIPTGIISQIARKDVTVVLSGDAGDELFCGYGRYNGWVLDEWNKQQRLPIQIQKIRGRALGMMGREKSVKARRLFSESLVQTYSAVAGHDTCFVNTDCLYEDSFDRFKNMNLSSFCSDQDVLMQMDFGQYLPDDILVKVDRAAMFHSLETRIPFLDRDVIEFVWSLPLEMKYHYGESKHILRRILYKRIPREVIERPKTGFSIPLERWMREDELKEWAGRFFEKKSIEKASDWLNIYKCQKMWQRFLREGKWSESLWYLIVFLQWINECV